MKSFLELLYVIYVIIFEGDFVKVDLRTVTTSLWKSDNPVLNTLVSWKLLIVLARVNYMGEELFGFLKYVGSFPKFLRSICSIVYPALYHLLAH